ncbi:AraC family transcriptional regulator [Paenibacillus tarimensis]|uniref:AraC family transcriptional regulator n=1 Tax=Paenibacillus tarimensis TaxID=416012 RepID=UPI001F4506BF|nr:AraC family transcriptional regulator [Paenibacillus tarimensis]MCF2944387.1 AraC family transcriptional regulator [Paenibacillus tarimensis]
MEWLSRMQNALDLIEVKLGERLEIDELAQAAYSSTFHFQRMFYMATGMTVAEYIRRRRLTLAAQELATSPARVLDVALKYGYDSPESFAKAFRKIHGMTPTEARNAGVQLKAFPRISFQLILKGDKDMDYRIVEKEAFRIVGKPLYTTYEQLREVPLFWNRCNMDGTSDRLVAMSSSNRMYGICMDMKPGTEDITYVIGVESDQDADDSEFLSRTIPASTWAVFYADGPVPHAIQQTYSRIFQEWFPSTGYEHSGAPEMEVYPAGDTASESYRTEIWIPVKKQ